METFLYAEGFEINHLFVLIQSTKTGKVVHIQIATEIFSSNS